jgi:hypothetical protein
MKFVHLGSSYACYPSQWERAYTSTTETIDSEESLSIMSTTQTFDCEESFLKYAVLF